MTGFLLDVNVLLALLWPPHTFHQSALRWFARKARQGWATSPITEAGFVRIVSNPRFSQDAPSIRHAISVLRESQSHPTHQFWADELKVAEALEPFEASLRGHQDVTDAYLLGLAIHKRGKLATFDQALVSLMHPRSATISHVELLRHQPG
jgi:uncharacterized protein